MQTVRHVFALKTSSLPRQAMDSNRQENDEQNHTCVYALAMRTTDGQGFIAAHPQPLDYIKPSRQPNL
jgi:hypothetical protein